VQLLQLKASSLIFVAVRDLTLIVSGKTRQRCKALDMWPEVELSAEARLAKVTLKDAREANIPEAELMEASDSTDQVSWKVIFLGNGKVRA